MKKILVACSLMLAAYCSFGQYQEIQNGESGYSTRTKMNTMFQQLYDKAANIDDSLVYNPLNGYLYRYNEGTLIDSTTWDGRFVLLSAIGDSIAAYLVDVMSSDTLYYYWRKAELTPQDTGRWNLAYRHAMNDADSSSTNELQTISLNITNDSIFLSHGGGSIAIPAGSASNLQTVTNNGATTTQNLTTGAYLYLGPNSAASHKRIYANNGQTYEPVLEFNETLDVWRFSNDGTTFYNIPTSTSGNNAITVREVDGTPNVSATEIRVTNGKATDLGSGVVSLDLSGGGFADPMTSVGDMIIRNSSNVTTRLPIDTDGKIMTISGGLPSWQTSGSSFWSFDGVMNSYKTTNEYPLSLLDGQGLYWYTSFPSTLEMAFWESSSGVYSLQAQGYNPVLSARTNGTMDLFGNNFKAVKTGTAKNDSIPTMGWVEDKIGSSGGGTVNSVGLSMPNIFTVTNSPVTASGTLSASLNSQNANLILASPNGSAGTPSFRSLVDDDVPNTITASNYLPLAGGTLSGKLIGATPTTSIASFNLPHGTAPTSPVNGDVWTTTTGIYVRINGTTVGPLGTGGGGSTTYLGLTDTPSSFTSNAFVMNNSGGTALVHTLQSSINISGFNNNSGFISSSGVTYENLNTNGDVGTSAGQLAIGNHGHSGVYEPANSNIQTHIGSTSNPHSVTATQVGNTTAQWNASKLQDFDLDTTDPTDGKIWVYRTATGKFVLEDKPVSSGSPAWGEITGTLSAQTDLNSALGGKQATLTGSESVFSGWDKNASDDFSGSYADLTNKPTIPTVSDAAYDATTWNGNTDAPSKNAIRDKIESLSVGGGGDMYKTTYDTDANNVVDNATQLNGQPASYYLDNTDAQSLGYTASTGALTISNGTGATLPDATTSVKGLMSAADKTKLDGIAASANNYSFNVAINGISVNTVDNGERIDFRQGNAFQFDVTGDGEDVVGNVNLSLLTKDATATENDSIPWIDNSAGQKKMAISTLMALGADNSATNEIQDLSLSGNTLSLSGDATTVDLSGYLDNTDSQNIGYTPSTRVATISGGTGFTMPLFSTTSTDAGLVPGGTSISTKFLRGDGTWQDAPSGGATNIDGLTDAKTDTRSIFLGSNAGFNDDGNNFNTAVGVNAFDSNTSGMYNTVMGAEAGSGITTGNWNTLYGYLTGIDITTGYDNIILGGSSQIESATDTSSIVIGTGVIGMGSKTTLIGNYDTENTYILGKQPFIKPGANWIPIDYKARQSLTPAASITMDFRLGSKASFTLSAATTITITNLPDGQDGVITITQNGSTAYTCVLAGSTGYTTTRKFGSNAAVSSTLSKKTKIVYERVNDELHYSYVYEN